MTTKNEPDWENMPLGELFERLQKIPNNAWHEMPIAETLKAVAGMREHPDFWCSYQSVKNALTYMENGGTMEYALRLLVLFGDEQ